MEDLPLYQYILSTTNDFFSVIDREYRYVSVNDTYLRLYDRKREDIIGRRVDELFDADVFETIIKKRLDHCLRGNVISYRDWFDLAALGRRCMNITYLPYRDLRGNIVGIVVNGKDITELAQALEEKERVERRLEMMSRAGNICLWDWDLKTNEMYFSPQWKKQLGYADHEIGSSYHDWEKCVHSEDLVAAVEREQKYIRKPWDDYSSEFRMLHKDGSYRWIITKASLLFDEKEERPIRMMGAHIDVTEQREREEALRESKKQYKDLFESIRDLILVADKDRTIIDCNQALLEMFGYEKDELLGQKTLALYENEEQFREMGEAIKKRINETAFLVTVRYRKKTAECFPGETSVYYLRNQAGDMYGVIGVIRDVSERLIAERRLKESESRFRSLVENLFDAVVVVNRQGEILFSNQAASDLFGRSTEELVGSPFGFPIFTDLTQEIDIIHKSGQRKFAEIKISLADWSGEEVLIASIRDTTEGVIARQEKERHMARLAQVQKLESIGTLAGGIAHDFNNILTPILGFTEIIRERISSDDDSSECLEEVYQSALRARDLVGQILTFSRQSKGSYRPIIVEPIIKEVLKLLRSVIPTTITIEQDIRSKGMIIGDETEIHQILMNLCTNAMHAMEREGGVMKVSFHDIKIEEVDTVRYHDLKPGYYVHLRVGDNGCGMKEDVAKKIFEPYFTTKGKEKGTGLGLSVVHGIVHNHGGTISVASEVGKGTTFDIFLPRSIGQKTRAEESIIEVEGGKEHILVVDDELAVLRLNAKVLKRLGYRVTTRAGSVEALALFERRSEDFDLLLSDMTMPEMTGEILAKKCLAIRPDLPVILVTGFSERINKEDAVQIGVRALLMKPFTKVQLDGALRAALEGHNPVKEGTYGEQLRKQLDKTSLHKENI